MLSRRNVRVKVFKSLYAGSQDELMTDSDVKKMYRKSVDMTYNMYLFSLQQLVKVAEYANFDAGIRLEKLLPTEEDKHFSTRLYNNPVTLAIAGNPEFAEALKTRALRYRFDSDLNRRFYQGFAHTPTYKEYLALDTEISAEQHVNILLELYKNCLKDEVFEELIDDLFYAWSDDKSLVVAAVKKTLKALPTAQNFVKEYEPDDETCVEYGLELLHKALFFDKELAAIIEPVLKNWDIDRVAIIDVVLLKMGICEFLYFPTIPIKVTLNEYVELAKTYSTPKSREFVNGVLDRLSKQLKKEGKIDKEGRGLVE